jgi:hypothetical protein
VLCNVSWYAASGLAAAVIGGGFCITPSGWERGDLGAKLSMICPLNGTLLARLHALKKRRYPHDENAGPDIGVGRESRRPPV